MNTSFYLMNAEEIGLSTVYTTEFIVDDEINSLLIIEISDDKIRYIGSYPVNQDDRIHPVRNGRKGYNTAFEYNGEYFPEDRILYMIGKACDEYDGYIEAMSSIKPEDEF